MAQQTQEQKAEEQKLKLYSNKLCPFGLRAWLTLTHKSIPHEFIHCSLKAAQKEDYFKEAYAKAVGHDPNNAGKVPILYHNGKYIAESLPVSRYLDHVFNDEAKYGPSLLPNDPFQRVSVEILIDWFNNSGWVRSHYGIIFSFDKQKSDTMAVEWKKKWKILDERLSQFTKEGLFLPNNRFSLFEINVFGLFERLIVIQELCGYPVYKEWMDEFPRVKSWYNACLGHETIKKCLQDPAVIVKAYKEKREEASKK